ncbi:TPA: hypothetical protein DDW35_06950 [Candidatus Sumerlaeota bacterium]|jgi:hypothetical protein|nr:hypothetical protein [Candidatus Sumerlaeota bacterium]
MLPNESTRFIANLKKHRCFARLRKKYAATAINRLLAPTVCRNLSFDGAALQRLREERGIFPGKRSYPLSVYVAQNLVTTGSKGLCLCSHLFC